MRKATLKRKTNETVIEVEFGLDGSGKSAIDTGVGFLDHMLDLFVRHGLFDARINAKGDHHIDDHHTVEDVGIVMGQAFEEAVGNKMGIRRYGCFKLPMDETLVSVALDISARPVLCWNVEFTSEKIGRFDTQLVREWFHAFTMNAGMTLHVDLVRGENSHHIAEACFKALARCLRQAVEIDPRQKNQIPSTKGSLDGGGIGEVI